MLSQRQVPAMTNLHLDVSLAARNKQSALSLSFRFDCLNDRFARISVNVVSSRSFHLLNKPVYTPMSICFIPFDWLQSNSSWRNRNVREDFSNNTHEHMFELASNIGFFSNVLLSLQRWISYSFFVLNVISREFHSFTQRKKKNLEH